MAQVNAIARQFSTKSDGSLLFFDDESSALVKKIKKNLNFAKLMYRESPNNVMADYQKTVDFYVDSFGDALGHMWIEINLIKNAGLANNTTLDIANDLGRALIDQVEIYAASQLIASFSSEYLHIDNSLNQASGLEQEFLTLRTGPGIGDAAKLKTQFSYRNQKLYVGIPFHGESGAETIQNLHELYPLKASELSQLRVRVRFSAANLCFNSSALAPTIHSAFLVTERFFFEKPISEQMANARFVKMKEQIASSSHDVSMGLLTTSFEVDLSAPTKEVIFVFRKSSAYGSGAIHRFDFRGNEKIPGTEGTNASEIIFESSGANIDDTKFNYNPEYFGYNYADYFAEMKLCFGSSMREKMDAMQAGILNRIQNHKKFENNYIYSYAFSLDPDELAGLIETASLPKWNLHFKHISATAAGTFFIFVKTVNILTIENGFAELLFSNSLSC